MTRVFYGWMLLSLSPLTVLAGTLPGHYGYLEIAHSRQNTDWGGFGDSSAGTLLAGAPLGRFVHVAARVNEGNVHLPLGLVQERWLTYGLGLHHYFARHTSVFIGAERHELETAGHDQTLRGWEYHIGVRHDFGRHVRLGLQVGENDVIFEDPTFTVEGLFQLPHALAVTTRLRDYDDLDLTEYEVGLRWQF